MRNITHLVVHCSATQSKQDIGRTEIDAMHKARGWKTIGYHYVIRRTGEVEVGRPEEQIGAHVAGHNATSIGICLVGGVDAKGRGENNFTAGQFSELRLLLNGLAKRYPKAQILGHRDLSSDKDGDGVIEKHEWLKECPCFDVREWMKA